MSHARVHRFSSSCARFFCGREGQVTKELNDDDHPAVYFAFPVKKLGLTARSCGETDDQKTCPRNVNIELTDLGRNGKGKKERRSVWRS